MASIAKPRVLCRLRSVLRNLCLQLTKMAELQPEWWLCEGYKDTRGGLRGWAGPGHAPTGFSSSAPHSPWSWPFCGDSGICHSRTCVPQLCSHCSLYQGYHLPLPSTSLQSDAEMAALWILLLTLSQRKALISCVSEEFFTHPLQHVSHFCLIFLSLKLISHLS